MLNRLIIGNILLLFFSIFFLISSDVKAGNPIISTDGGADRLVYYFDNRERTTHIQLANISDMPARVHIQVFAVNSIFQECEEADWDDRYTPYDTHIYDTTNLVTNDPAGGSLTIELDELYGFIVVSLEEGSPNSLIGVIRIMDDMGYEYRANAATPEVSPAANENLYNKIDFSSTSNNYSFSDVIGITYLELNSSTVYASPGVGTIFGNVLEPIIIWDEDELQITCSPTAFSCAEGSFNIGLDNSLPNSRGVLNRFCATSILSTNKSGSVEMMLDAFYCTDPLVGEGDHDNTCSYNAYFVGFVGLNNNSDAGSFDSWWEKGLKD